MTKSESILTVTPKALFSVLKGSGRGLRVLDVRERPEFLEGHLPGALSAPLSAFLLWKTQIDPEEYIYLYSGAERRALTVARRLTPQCKNVWILEGGWSAWIAENLPFERGESGS